MSNSQAAVRIALETRLAAMVGVLPTVHQNEKYTPVAGTPYQHVALLPADPANPTLGNSFYRERGLFQITLFYPLLNGTAAGSAVAGAIVAWFPRGLTLTQSGITTLINKTPAVAPGFENDGWWVIPVRVPYTADVHS